MTISFRRALTLAGAVALAMSVSVVGAATAHAEGVVATADAYVDASLPTTNFGSKTYVYADNSPVRTAYLTFTVPSGADTSNAKLELYPESSNSIGVTLHQVTDTSWSEAAITAANAPPVGTALGSSGRITAGTVVRFDVSSVVTGPGTYGFALRTTSSTAAKITSRNGSTAANRPQLTYGPGNAPPSSFLVSRVSDTYLAVADTGQTYTGSLKFVGERAVADLNSSGGGTVTFTAGTFEFGAEFFNFDDINNIVFDGAGIDATIIRNSNSSASDTEPFNLSGADFITISDLTVVAGGAARTTSDAIDFDNGSDSRVERVKITASRGRGIVFDGKNTGFVADRNVVSDCVIDGVLSHGIEFLASSDNTVSGCTITNTSSAGINITKSSTSSSQPNKKSSNNTISNNTIDQSGRDGIVVNSGDQNRILGNTVTNSSDDVASRDGIRIQSSDGITCDGNEVSGNTSTDNQAVKTQRYGLNINNPQCNGTVVGANNLGGNLVSDRRDLGTGTVG